MYVAIFQLLDHQSWYTGGNGDDAQVMPCLVLPCNAFRPARSCCCVSCWKALWNGAETWCIAQCFGTVSQLVVATSYDMKSVVTWCQRVVVRLCVTSTLLTHPPALRSSMHSGNEHRARQPRLVHASNFRPVTPMSLQLTLILVLLQNPVITVVWCICLVQIIVPAIMFPFECYPYCKKANKAEMVLVGALLVYMSLCCLLGPGFYDANDIFGFYGLPFSFTYKLEVLCLVFSVGYVVVLVKARQLLARYEARRIVSFPHSNC